MIMTMKTQKKQPGYKPLKLKKTAIASLTLNQQQMQAILGGGGTAGNTPMISYAANNNPCTSNPPSHPATV